MEMCFKGQPTKSFSWLENGKFYEINAVPSSFYNIMVEIIIRLDKKEIKSYYAYESFETFFDNWEVVNDL